MGGKDGVPAATASSSVTEAVVAPSDKEPESLPSAESPVVAPYEDGPELLPLAVVPSEDPEPLPQAEPTVAAAAPSEKERAPPLPLVVANSDGSAPDDDDVYGFGMDDNYEFTFEFSPGSVDHYMNELSGLIETPEEDVPINATDSDRLEAVPALHDVDQTEIQNEARIEIQNVIGDESDIGLARNPELEIGNALEENPPQQENDVHRISASSIAFENVSQCPEIVDNTSVSQNDISNETQGGTTENPSGPSNGEQISHPDIVENGIGSHEIINQTNEVEVAGVTIDCYEVKGNKWGRRRYTIDGTVHVLKWTVQQIQSEGQQGLVQGTVRTRSTSYARLVESNESVVASNARLMESNASVVESNASLVASNVRLETAMTQLQECGRNLIDLLGRSQQN